MKTLALQKRIAASVLGVGKNRVKFDPERLADIREAITKVDIHTLIKEGVIKKKPVRGVKRRAGKIRQKRKRKGRRRGTGKKRKIVNKRKQDYVKKIRKMRKHLNSLKKAGSITPKEHTKLRRLAKVGTFRSITDIKEYIKAKRE